ncbi:Rdx family protein [Natrialba sp. INN-245]|uniref:SelT/SelW/SelH family protein n=1 Tax=Natrialba sp. INN-245 TaxID=2690967 RepID=UPI00130FA649|nr:Rdx family protein [Natrialba sp. INN-245]MWV39354.1 SelT/SelW/SelH family protein [Natrialba sp. INN-245]
MTTVDVEYCVPCGHLSRAEDVQHVLLTTFGERLDSVTLSTGRDGVFVVRVDDKRVFDVAEDEYDVDGIVRRVRSHL